jgi:hypothetical protein
MYPTPLPEIDESDLKAAREFLTSSRDEERSARLPHIPLNRQGAVPVRNGIARARARARTGSKPTT